MKEGDLNKESSSVEVSNVMIGGTYSTPLIDDKLSLIVGGRISPLQLEYNAFSSYFRGNNFLPNEISALVYDLYAKAKYYYSSKSEITFTAFG